MLKVRCTRKLGKDAVVVDDNSVVIVEDELGNPVVVVVYVQPRIYTVVTPDDPDFNRILEGLGVNKVVVNNPLILPIPPEGEFKLLRGPTGLTQ